MDAARFDVPTLAVRNLPKPASKILWTTSVKRD
jgi:hypothetical protein